MNVVVFIDNCTWFDGKGTIISQRKISILNYLPLKGSLNFKIVHFERGLWNCLGVKPVKALNAVEKYAGVLNPTIEDISDMGSSPCLRSFSASLKRTAFMQYREELPVISVIRT